MGDTQTNSYATSAAQTITEARSSLRSSYQRGLGLQFSASGGSQGILDAFADVFSQMALAKPVDAKPENQTEDLLTASSGEPDQEASAAEEHDETSEVESKSEANADVALLGAMGKVEQVDPHKTGDGETVSDDKSILKATSEESSDQSQKERLPEQMSEMGDQLGDPSAEAVVQENVDESLVSDEKQVDSKSGKAKQNVEVKPVVQNEVVVEKASSDDSAVENPLGSVVQSVGEAEEGTEDDGKKRRGNRRNRRGVIDPNQKVGAERAADAAASQRRAAEQAADQANVSSTTQSSAPTVNASEISRPQSTVVPQAVADPNAAAAAATTRAVSAVASATGATSNATGRSERTSVNAVTGGSEANRANTSTKKQAGQTEKSSKTDLISRAKLIQRVSKAFQHLGPNGGHVRLRLAPAELGTVRLEMHIQQRKIQTRVVAETEAAASALRENLPELRQRLESQGMQIEKMSVEVESESQNGNRSFGDHSSSGQDDDGRQFDRPWRRPPASSEKMDRDTKSQDQISPEGLQGSTSLTGGVDVRW
ncbi:Flagellar hook-length control protein FliK [Planctomycetes bacterium CA13]|uniref:Flagellar hook-length control protein FliK n=1 Tax=Novipirellula herctigrandis TaxID=2527986 RepID=A0A5C5Z8G7_9BACT|nr:Flagellar hook-length control protein FliK [Planctomycetes bacterium CA13]